MAGLIRWAGVCLDCCDVEELATFYEKILGWTITYRDVPETRAGGEGWIGMTDPSGGINLSFQGELWYEPPTWPETPDVQTKMIHFEMSTDDMDAAVALVLEAGGSEAPQQPKDRDPQLLRIMLDPAGHPFCLCAD